MKSPVVKKDQLSVMALECSGVVMARALQLQDVRAIPTVLLLLAHVAGPGARMAAASPIQTSCSN